jgi:hypothetical protein
VAAEPLNAEGPRDKSTADSTQGSGWTQHPVDVVPSRDPAASPPLGRTPPPLPPADMAVRAGAVARGAVPLGPGGSPRGRRRSQAGDEGKPRAPPVSPGAPASHPRQTDQEADGPPRRRPAAGALREPLACAAGTRAAQRGGVPSLPSSIPSPFFGPVPIALVPTRTREPDRHRAVTPGRRTRRSKGLPEPRSRGTLSPSDPQPHSWSACPPGRRA